MIELHERLGNEMIVHEKARNDTRKNPAPDLSGSCVGPSRKLVNAEGDPVSEAYRAKATLE